MASPLPIPVVNTVSLNRKLNLQVTYIKNEQTIQVIKPLFYLSPYELPNSLLGRMLDHLDLKSLHYIIG